MWKLIIENSFVGAFVASLTVILIVWAVNLARRFYRANRVYKVLEQELKKRDKRFLSTPLLAAKTGYTENGVEALCSFHKKIPRNEKELQSWQIPG